jgi:RNA polymerase sigma factor (sigma-70 family)
MAEDGPSRDADWTEFEKTYGDVISGWCRAWRVPADKIPEVLQNVLLKLWSGIRKYTPEEGKFHSYLARIVRNVACDLNRELKRFQGRGTPADESDRLAELPDEHTMTSTLDNMIVDEIKQLAFDRVQQQVLPLEFALFCRRCDGADVAELAKEFQFEENRVYRVIYKIRDMMIKEVAHLNDGGPD